MRDGSRRETFHCIFVRPFWFLKHMNGLPFLKSTCFPFHTSKLLPSLLPFITKLLDNVVNWASQFFNFFLLNSLPSSCHPITLTEWVFRKFTSNRLTCRVHGQPFCVQATWPLCTRRPHLPPSWHSPCPQLLSHFTLLVFFLPFWLLP